MKTSVKVKSAEPSNGEENSSKAELPNALTSDSECVKTRRREVARCAVVSSIRNLFERSRSRWTNILIDFVCPKITNV